MSSYTRQQLEAYLKTIDVRADRVLDIGGSQLPIKGRTKSWEVGEYHIMDMECPHEQKRKPDFVVDLNHRDSQFNDLVVPDGFKYESYDVVFGIELMEYVLDPLDTIRSMRGFLKTYGIIYLSFHLVYPHHEPTACDYFRYTKSGAQKLLTENGFEIMQIVPRMAQGASAYQFYKSNLMRPAKSMKQSEHEEIGWIIKAKKSDGTAKKYSR